MISENQLMTWANQGSVTNSKRTHEAIRNALSANSELNSSFSYEVFLQGSYKNDTNIRGDSDVDLVVKLTSIFEYDISLLPPAEATHFRLGLSPSNFPFQTWKESVFDALRAYFSSPIPKIGGKSIKLPKGSWNLGADVVSAFEFRRYYSFRPPLEVNYDEGIVLYSEDGKRIVNFPKLHYNNGVKKNSESETNQWYKPTVRLLKNMRNRLQELGRIDGDHFPSYFVECLAYNAPSYCYGGSFRDTLSTIIQVLWQTDISHFSCQNGIIPLFGTNTDQWSPEFARNFLLNCSKLME